MLSLFPSNYCTVARESCAGKCFTANSWDGKRRKIFGICQFLQCKYSCYFQATKGKAPNAAGKRYRYEPAPAHCWLGDTHQHASWLPLDTSLRWWLCTYLSQRNFLYHWLQPEILELGRSLVVGVLKETNKQKMPWCLELIRLLGTHDSPHCLSLSSTTLHKGLSQ